MNKRRCTEKPDVFGKIIHEGDTVQVTDFHGHKNNWIVIWEDYSFSLIDADGDGDKYGIYTRRFALNYDTYEIIRSSVDPTTKEETIL
jgi:hypothetical protein